jgi:hypothetical protein
MSIHLFITSLRHRRSAAIFMSLQAIGGWVRSVNIQTNHLPK